MHRPGFGAPSSSRGLAPRGRPCALSASTARSYASRPACTVSAPRARGFLAWLRGGASGQDARVGGTAVAFSNEQHRRRYAEDRQASRAEARRQPRLSRAAPRAAQRAVARQVALGCRLSRAARACTPGQELWPQRASSTGSCSTSRTASAPSAGSRPGARSASIIATRRNACAGSCATSATPHSACSTRMSAACWRPWLISTAPAALPPPPRRAGSGQAAWR